MSEIGHNSNGAANEHLKSFVERIERLEEEKAGLTSDILGIQPECMTKEELREICGTLISLCECGLTDWEIDFVEDMLERLEKYEERTIISDRQQQTIDDMEQKYL